VNVGDAEIKVLGTQFNVSAYTDSKNIVTTLLDGSVEFYVHSGQENPIRLKPNQQVVYDKVARTSQLREVEAELYASWKDGVLYFDHVGLEEMSKILAHRFGIRIEIHAKNLQNETFSGMFENDMSLYQILDVLKRHRGFDYRKDGDYIVIFDK
jgi:ferric-dicitrate binding protein FerR (iron transport regulator)